ncbi:MAG: hypothetical protein DRJ96_09170, partial [Thermoprotei archaeon]
MATVEEGAKRVHEIELPAKVVTGSGALEKLSPLLKSLGFSCAAILTGPHVKSIVGWRVEKLLASSGIEAHLHVVEGSGREDV